MTKFGRRFREFLILTAVLASASAVRPAAAQVVLDLNSSDTMGAEFWLDRSRPNENTPPSLQSWSAAVTTPLGVHSLDQIRIYGTLGTGPTLRVALTGPDGTWTSAIMNVTRDSFIDFDAHIEILPGVSYVLDLIGSGADGLFIAQNATNGNLFENGHPFGDYGLRSTFTFDGAAMPAPDIGPPASGVPETATWIMFSLGAGALGASSRRRRAAVQSTSKRHRFALGR